MTADSYPCGCCFDPRWLGQSPPATRDRLSGWGEPRVARV